MNSREMNMTAMTSPPSIDLEKYKRSGEWELTGSVAILLCSSAVLDPRVGHTMDVLSPFIPVLCHSD